MIEILPISSLRDDDSLLFGQLNILLAKLSGKFPVAKGIVVTPPNLHLQTVLEHFDFKAQEIFEQSLTLVKKELEKTPIPEILEKELKSNQKYFALDLEFNSVKELWSKLLEFWLNQVKQKIWTQGFSEKLTSDLEPVIVIFIEKLESFGEAFYDNEEDDVVIEIKKGKLSPPQLRKLDELIREVNKKILLPYQYSWVLDGQLKIVEILPFTPIFQNSNPELEVQNTRSMHSNIDFKSTTKVFLDLSTGLVIDTAGGIFIDSEKTLDLEELTFKLVESASLNLPVLFKLPKTSFNLIHQDNMLNPLMEILKFAKDKKALNNISLVIPKIRGVSEFMEIKKKLAVKNLTRKNIEHWLDLSVPENVLNLEDYLITGVDGIVLNLDQLIGSINGFDHNQEELTHYKHEVSGLIKFLEPALKLLHKSEVPFLSQGQLSLNSTILDFLVSNGIHGIIVEKYEVPSMKEFLYKTEKRLITSRS